MIPQKLMQLIAAAEGAHSGSGGEAGPGAVWTQYASRKLSNPTGEHASGAVAGTVPAWDGTGGGGNWTAASFPLQEEEVIQAIRLLTRFGEVGSDPSRQDRVLQARINKTDANTKINLQQLLQSLAATVPAQQTDTPLLMKAAEHMAIRFALERFQKGEVKVNAVHQMLEHMSRQMDSLRQILRLQEDKMSKAGILVESHADILDRMFWAEVPDAGKKSVLFLTKRPVSRAKHTPVCGSSCSTRVTKKQRIGNSAELCIVPGRQRPGASPQDRDRLGQLADLFASSDESY